MIKNILIVVVLIIVTVVGCLWIADEITDIQCIREQNAYERTGR
jgi:hypothetical protein